MSIRPLRLLALFVLSAPALAGERLLVASPDGQVFAGNPFSGALAPLAVSGGGPVSALAADERHLYVADDLGQLFVADAESGQAIGLFDLGLGPISAVVSARGQVFVATPGGLLARYDARIGTRLSDSTAPAGILALAAVGSTVFAACDDGAIYSTPLAGGAFTYSVCFCLPSAQDLVADGNELVASDGFGQVLRFDEFLNISGWQIFPLHNAFALSAGDYIMHTGSKTLRRFDSESGASLRDFACPVDVAEVVVVRGERPFASGVKPPRKP